MGKLSEEAWGCACSREAEGQEARVPIMSRFGR